MQTRREILRSLTIAGLLAAAAQAMPLPAAAQSAAAPAAWGAAAEVPENPEAPQPEPDEYAPYVVPETLSGPSTSGHASLFCGPLQPPMNTSPSVAW
mgnify:CR=1 FL=1